MDDFTSMTYIVLEMRKHFSSLIHYQVNKGNSSIRFFKVIIEKCGTNLNKLVYHDLHVIISLNNETENV